MRDDLTTTKKLNPCDVLIGDEEETGWKPYRTGYDLIGEDEESEVWMGTDAESDDESSHRDSSNVSDSEEKDAYYDELYEQCKDQCEPNGRYLYPDSPEDVRGDDEGMEEVVARENTYHEWRGKHRHASEQGGTQYNAQRSTRTSTPKRLAYSKGET